MQSQQSEVIVRTDSGWAGCRRARKSTSGGSISIGEHCIKTWSKTQAVIAKSSAESELYGVVRGACEGIRIKTLCMVRGLVDGLGLSGHHGPCERQIELSLNWLFLKLIDDFTQK